MEITHENGVDPYWIYSFAQKLGGDVEGPFLRIPSETVEGTFYFLRVSDSISTFIVDVVFNQSHIFHLRNTKNNFVTLHFDFTEGDAFHILDNVANPVGRWEYNVALYDSSLDADYVVKEGSATYSIDIHIDKKELRRILSGFPQFRDVLNTMFDADKNTFLRYGRTSNKAWWLINELRNTNQTDPLYDIIVKSTVYNLLSDYLDQIMNQEILLEKVVKEDLVAIIDSQSFLLTLIESTFPGIKDLAMRAMMSETKYKTLFRKITGLSPNAFFLQNKLNYAKQMLETGQYTISEVTTHYNFANASYFADQFKKLYGIPPKDYLTHM
ncbi:helix-turn-helix transcriptional regulator [Sphingobacterium spiritivorum]|uniref:helix-turn-helix transcriptional regulator n=1 Tax=Sphingobacterium spiritivorum TaxID=258 RepID=UPI003DA68A7C